MILKKALVLLIIIFVIAGCAPTLKNSAFRAKLEPAQHFVTPKISRIIGVANLKDSRPFGERFKIRTAIADLFFYPVSFGLIGLLRLNPASRVQPISNIDNDMSDYFALHIEKANIFERVIRLPQKTETLLSDRQMIKHLREKVDFVLVGEIKRFYGEWNESHMLSRTEEKVPGLGYRYNPKTVTTTTYSLTDCYGITSLSLKVIDTATGNEIWSKDIESYWPCEGGISIEPYEGDIPERNRLAARSFDRAIYNVITELEQWANIHSGTYNQKSGN